MAKINKWQQILDTQAKALGEGTNSLEKDRATNKAKDGYSENGENYLAQKKSKKEITNTSYTNNNITEKTPFSSPREEQQIVEPTNMGEYDDYESESISYSDPIISTKPTPTSIKLGVPRPGPSTMIQTARYNPSTKRLNIQYKDGKVFPYYDVSPELADMILRKKSNHSPGQTLLGTLFYGNGTTKYDEISDIDEGM